MHSLVLWNTFFSLHLFSLSLALPTTNDPILPNELPGKALLPRASKKTSTVPVSNIRRGGLYLYWSVIANVNGEDVEVIADTGSSDFWLKGPKAPSPKGDTKGAPLMKIQGKEQDFAIEYIWPRGVTSGPVVSTDVKLGNLTVTNFGVGTATKVANYYPYDGFMGLAFSGGNSVQPNQQPTIMEAAIAQGSVEKTIFTMGFKPTTPGTLNFGYVDPALHTGEFVTAQVDGGSSGWYAEEMSLSAGKAKIMQPMLFDTGTGTTMTADAKFVSDFWAQVKGSSNETGQYAFPCDSNIPSMQVGVGKGESHPIAGTTFNAGKAKDQKGICVGGLQNQADSYGLPGAPFFLTMLVAFDQHEPSVGFAPQTQP